MKMKYAIYLVLISLLSLSACAYNQTEDTIDSYLSTDVPIEISTSF